MSPVGAIVRKELRSYFVSPVAYVVASVFLLLTGLLSFLAIATASNRSMQLLRVQGSLPELNLNEFVFRPVFYNMAVILLLVVPILTMRLFAEEKKLKTMELLVTSPVTITDIVVGKFVAALTVFAAMLALSAVAPVVLAPFAEFRWPPIRAAYLAVLLMGGLFLSAGLLGSSLTENQIIAVIVSFGALLLFWLFGWAGQVFAGTALGKVLSYLSPLDHFDQFVKGLVATKDLVYFVAGIVFTLFLTHRDRIAAVAVMSNRLTFLLGVLGGVLAGAGVVIYALAPERTALIATVEGLAAACLTVFLVTHFELFREFSTRRATRLGLNSILMIVLMGTILGILNFLAARHSVRWDFSESKRFTLAPQTARLLRELPREVKVTVFTSDQSPVRLAYRDLIDSYQTHTAKLTVEFVDPEKKPGVARQYGITRPDTAVLESGKQEMRITSASEQELTNALIRVTKDEKKNVYFLTGHAEHTLEDGSKEGYSFLKEALERQGYTVRSLSLYESKTIPTKASVLVLAGPQKPVSPAEQVRLADYVRTDGRLLLLLDPGSRAGLEGTLAAWGLRTDNRTVLDTQTILGGDLTMPVVNTYGTHEITQDLGQVFTMFPLARPVSFLDSKGNEWAFHPLAKSSPRSWARTGEMTQTRDFNPRKDTQGPLTLAALVVARANPSENARQPAVLLVGDSDFASNAFLDFSGNTDFILHAVAWLAEEKDLVTIAPKDTTLGTLLLTAAQSNALFVLQVLGLPGFFLLAGFAVWRHRRRL